MPTTIYPGKRHFPARLKCDRDPTARPLRHLYAKHAVVVLLSCLQHCKVHLGLLHLLCRVYIHVLVSSVHHQLCQCQQIAHHCQLTQLPTVSLEAIPQFQVFLTCMAAWCPSLPAYLQAVPVIACGHNHHPRLQALDIDRILPCSFCFMSGRLTFTLSKSYLSSFQPCYLILLTKVADFEHAKPVPRSPRLDLFWMSGLVDCTGSMLAAGTQDLTAFTDSTRCCSRSIC